MFHGPRPAGQNGSHRIERPAQHEEGHGLAWLQAQYPDLAVTLFSEGMGAAERRVRDGSATLGLCALLPSTAQELQAIPLTQAFLLAGYGWGTMPRHLVQPHIDAGSLVELAIDDPGVQPGSIGLFAIHDRQRPLGLGARWLLAQMQQQAWLEVG